MFDPIRSSQRAGGGEHVTASGSSKRENAVGVSRPPARSMILPVSTEQFGGDPSVFERSMMLGSLLPELSTLGQSRKNNLHESNVACTTTYEKYALLSLVGRRNASLRSPPQRRMEELTYSVFLIDARPCSEHPAVCVLDALVRAESRGSRGKSFSTTWRIGLVESCLWCVS